jgi:hypothetical protein
MKILILTFYYPPDLSAGSFRAGALVKALRQLAPKDSEISVITTLPNRYATFDAAAPAEERDGMVSVRRIALPGHRSGMADQSRAFLHFAREARRLAAGDFDIVFATSSRLMTAALGAWIARRSGARYYADIRDIFVDTIKDIVGQSPVRYAVPAFGALERWTIGRADKINLVSPGFRGYFRGRYPRKTFSFFTNGVDDEFIAAVEGAIQPAEHGGRTPLRAVYAGNIGEGQGLHVILPELAKRLDDRVRFEVIGDGGRREALAEALARSGTKGVEIHHPLARDELITRYLAADVLFLHLNDHPAFHKVLPSKIFEYAALGKPIWAGVAGYAAEFLRREVPNASIFDPCDVTDAVRAFDALDLRAVQPDEFIARHSRSSISRALATDILATVG